jgi:RPN1 N-terminal domain
VHLCIGDALFWMLCTYASVMHCSGRRRHLAGEIGAEWAERVEAEKPTDDLLTLVQQIVPFHMAHNAEPEAVDLLLEVLEHRWRC